MQNWRLLSWLSLSMCCHFVECIKDIALFLSQDIDVSVSKILRQLSNRFDVIMRSTGIEERNFCAKVPYEFAKQEGQTALFIIPLTTERVPKCERIVEGNVVLANVRKHSVKYGSAFDGDVGLQEGGVDKLMDYLNNITVSLRFFNRIMLIAERIRALERIY
ncbi:hypothetical protein Y032_0053g2337 [Ancylostoma ceylanicum]|uniref:Uncharacterized protein n=1 Tax=Ancylostoma ceylanicum TaxID=53326 RepID=A0A016U6Q8_9BILA|nr:hypothetical protein Y032_0053g2337 [Ancylostoma ceylanicum]